MQITRHYLNVPIGRQASSRLFTLSVDGKLQREIPLQLAEDKVDYWIFLDVHAFNGKTVTFSGPAAQPALDRIYQADAIEGAANLYQESNRPLIHFTTKRGWSNDINGPIYYRGQYHLFWQSFPFGVLWNTGFMYWGHAVSQDLVHWRELDPALMLDKLGSPWSGTALVDHNNDGGWGKNALVLVYTAFDRATEKEVQCIAYSTDGGKSFVRYAGNPVLDSNAEMGTNQTRDPKVFWYPPTKHWVMTLFEKDGMSFYTSTDLKAWTKKSHFRGLFECPDFFELPVDGDLSRAKWVLHGGSSTYYIGSFDGETFKAESPELYYAEGKNAKGDDLLYAAESFAEMPDRRRVQMAWGRIEEPGMPFTQMMLFPTEFRLKTTPDGLRLLASPIAEIAKLQKREHVWNSLAIENANEKLRAVPAGPVQVKAQLTLEKGKSLTIRYQGKDLISLDSTDTEHGSLSVEVLLDKCVAEIFVNNGRRYVVRELAPAASSLSFESSVGGSASPVSRLDVAELRSMWESSLAGK